MSGRYSQFEREKIMFGNLSGTRIRVTNLDIASIPANSTAVTTVAIAGLPDGMLGSAAPADGVIPVGLVVAGVSSTAGVLRLTLANVTAAAIDPAAAAWDFTLLAPSGEESEVTI